MRGIRELILRELSSAADKGSCMSLFPANSGTLATQEESVLGRFPELAGRRVALVGLDSDAGARLSELLGGAGAFCRISPAAGFEAESLTCDLVFVSLPAAEDQPKTAAAAIAPTITVLSAASMGQRHSWIKTAAADCMFYPCTSEEILTRAAVALHHKPLRSGRPPRDQFRVLVADDDPAITALLKETLESADLTCRWAADGLDTLAIAREWNPDLIVLDVNMPGMDGYRVLAALKGANSEVRTRVMMLTAHDQESEVLKGLRLGAEDYVVKPFNPVEVLMRIKRMVTRPV
jgi:CheY-like chemotaxis protein